MSADVKDRITDEEMQGPQPETEQPKDAGTVWVVSGRSDNRVALYEKDRRHPIMGEAFVAGKTPTEVYRTNMVERYLREEVIRVVEKPELTKKQQPKRSEG
jgi:hypothetical protein